MSELADCPFCGSPDIQFTAEQADAVTWYGQVACFGCGLVTHSEDCWRSEKEAIDDVSELWSNRAP
jgi:hypothetical protein